MMSFKGGDRGAERSARGRGGDGGGRALSIAREPASFGARGLERQLPRRPPRPVRVVVAEVGRQTYEVVKITCVFALSKHSAKANFRV